MRYTIQYTPDPRLREHYRRKHADPECAYVVAVTAAFAPQSKTKLHDAIDLCIRLSHCSAGPNGPIGSWDVSAVTDMSGMFSNAQSFNQDLSAWDVSGVTNMRAMFYGAQSFNQDLSVWDVSAVTDMSGMFDRATSLEQRPCSVLWINSKAKQDGMFKSISLPACTSTSTIAAATTDHNRLNKRCNHLNNRNDRNNDDDYKLLHKHRNHRDRCNRRDHGDSDGMYRGGGGGDS